MAMPTALRPSLPTIETSPSLPDAAASSDEAGPSLVKRHNYYLSCGTEPQQPGISFKGLEDIKLARRCLASPFRYNCDAGKRDSVSIVEAGGERSSG